MQDLFAQDQLNGEALRHLPKSSWMPIPNPAGFSLPWALHRIQMKLVPSSLASLCLSWLWGRRVGEKGEAGSGSGASVKVVDQGQHLVDLFPPPGVLGGHDPTLGSSSGRQIIWEWSPERWNTQHPGWATRQHQQDSHSHGSAH